MLNAYADMIDAHMAGMSGPVAWMTHHDEPMLFLSREEAATYCDDNEAPIPLYLALPIDLAAVREVIAHLRDTDETYLADKLEAALPELKP